jgi:cell division protein ZapB
LTDVGGGSILSAVMDRESTHRNMTQADNEKLELAALESRVDELIKTIESLATENKALRNQQSSLTAERASLIEKTEQARVRVEAMISRLKAMETR